MRRRRRRRRVHGDDGDGHLARHHVVDDNGRPNRQIHAAVVKPLVRHAKRVRGQAFVVGVLDETRRQVARDEVGVSLREPRLSAIGRRRAVVEEARVAPHVVLPIHRDGRAKTHLRGMAELQGNAHHTSGQKNTKVVTTIPRRVREQNFNGLVRVVGDRRVRSHRDGHAGPDGGTFVYFSTGTVDFVQLHPKRHFQFQASFRIRRLH